MKIISYKLTDENTLEIVVKEPSNMMYDCNPPRPVPDYVYKLVYGLNAEGKITLLRNVKGEHQPAYTVAERIEFEDSQK